MVQCPRAQTNELPPKPDICYTSVHRSPIYVSVHRDTCMAGWLIGWLVGWLIGWLAGRLAGCLAGLQAGCDAGWLVGWLAGWLMKAASPL